MSFPKDFVWGAATASYQVEGAAYEDGKGLSVWDVMCQQPGKIWEGNTGEVACDHYHRYQEDARLMGEIGLKGYRLSISWPRVLPEGVGAINEKGLAFYDRLIDALLENGGAQSVRGPDGPPLTAMEGRMTPEALYWGSRFLFERYQLPIVITENGMSNCDWIHRDGKVHDPQRIDFIARYLSESQRAIDDGVVVKGYFLWSIMDNFEWAQGYKQRFGIIYVDYATGERTLKDSAYWYRDVIASNGDIL